VERAAMTLRWNVVANLAGVAVTSMLAIAFTPIYVRYLGIEAYGLLGLFATLQAIFTLLDLGLGVTLSRTLARLASVPDAQPRQRSAVRTLQRIYGFAAILIAVVPLAIAEPIATHWMKAPSLPHATVVAAVRLMGVMGAAQFLFGFYQAGLIGMQRQVAMNALTSITGILRATGAVAVLVFLHAGVTGFFVWFATVTSLQALACAILLWRSVGGMRGAAFDPGLLRGERRFAAMVSANAIVGVFLTQSDKLILSTVVPLSEFGYYTLAGTIVAGVWLLIAPLTTAVLPRLTELWARNDELTLGRVYSVASQTMAALLIPAVAILCLFPREVIFAWTGSAAAVQETALIVPLLAGAVLFHGLHGVPGQMQLAAGWPELIMYTNLASIVVLLPALFFAARRWGAPGAAMLSLVINACHLAVVIVMHRRLLVSLRTRWWLVSVAAPLAAGFAVAFCARAIFVDDVSRPLLVVQLAAVGIASASATVLASADLRRAGISTLRTFMPGFGARVVAKGEQ
jgi:O-antigen/teichoic acid export membrane protein